VDESNPPANVKFLELAKLNVYCSDVFALMDTGAIPDVVSKSLCLRLNLPTVLSDRRITTATGEKSEKLEVVENLPVLFGNVAVELSFLVVDKCPYEMIIGRPTMRSLKGGGRLWSADIHDGERWRNRGPSPRGRVHT